LFRASHHTAARGVELDVGQDAAPLPLRWNITIEQELPYVAKNRRLKMGRGLLLWLIGIPIPIILLIWIFGGLS
jgi:hypothetical protein